MYSGKSLISVAILLACGTIALSARDCPKACTLEFNQVCASNGQEYRLFDNPCMMDAFNCEHEFLWTRTKSLEPCKTALEGITTDTKNCLKPCTFEYMPVCGFNGERYQIFGNLCDMNNAHCDDGKLWSVSNFIECEAPQENTDKFNELNECVRPCGIEFTPICAFDGEDYELFDNVCELHNAECGTKKHLKPAPFTACVFIPMGTQVNENLNCEKPCTREYNPICGFNGFTHEVFSNQCNLENAHCKDGKKWMPTSFSQCIEFTSEVDKKTHNCEKPCNRMYKPVCGTDGQTYKVFGNECMMENEHCHDNHEWKATTFALCETPIPLVQAPKEECIKICPFIYAPVCATDGQTYRMFDNKCLMEKEQECEGHQWHATTFALCENPIPLAQAPKEECIKICPFIYAPVCGTDGQTYQMFDNKCLMEKEQECDGHQWHATTFALCENPIPLAQAPKEECIKICPRIYAPVCGTDGQTYQMFDNKCLMEKEQECDGHQWHATTFALCENPIPLAQAPKEECIKICPFIYAPVCGTDGQTYQMFDNKCLMEKEQECDGHQWHATTFALCENPIPLAKAPKEECIKICPFIYAPVCATDGQTYRMFDNKCLMEKEQECDGHQWHATTFALCENPIPLAKAPKEECIKICPFIYAPVCGTDGQTYRMFDNKCLMEKEQECDGHQWHATTFALCENPIPLAQAPKECIKICPRIYAPVCGTDGQTYQMFDNKCLMEKEQECDGHQWHATTFALCENPIPLAQTPKTNNLKVCPLIYAPVCGTDGQTYKLFDNKCVMESEKEYDGHHWHATTLALCQNPIPLAVAPKKPCPMICPLNYLPICAFNGKTHHIFSNGCELEQFNCQNNEHFMATLMNECEIIPKLISQEVAICPAIYAPQCGFDGLNYKVFANQCMMDYFNRGHKSEQFAHVELSLCRELM